MKSHKNNLKVIKKATKIYRNPDDFKFGSFAVERLEELGEYTILLLTGIDTRTNRRGKVLEYVIKTDNGIQGDGKNSPSHEISS